MNLRPGPSSWISGWGAVLALAVLIAVGLVWNWLIAAGLLVVLLGQLARPLDFLLGFLLVAAGASFVRYEAGQLTRELSVLSGLILFMLVSYAWSNRGRSLALPRTSLLIPLLSYVGLSLVNYARGLFSGLSPKYATLELLPVLALASALLVANGFDVRRDLRFATAGLLAIGYGSASLGFYFFATYHTRSGGIYFLPVPGMMAMLALNLALRARGTGAALVWSALTMPLLLHQFISFTRGYWMGCLAGLFATLLLHVRWGTGVGTRLRRAGLVYASLLVFAVLGGVGLSLVSGQVEILTLAGSRLGSITETRFTHESASNLARLAEYAEVISHIAAAPWFGHGLGYALNFREPIGFELAEQWYVHQIYLFVWLKQGLLGLLVFVWMLWAAFAFCVRTSRGADDPWRSAWLAAAAACTAFLAVLDLSNFHFTNVNATFLLALLWGGAMAIGCEGFVRFRWVARDPSTPPRSAP